MEARTREEESSLSGYEQEFQRSADELKAAGLEGRVSVSDAQKLTLYALYKQATVGDCRSPAPSAFRPVEKAKWYAPPGTSWQGVQGMEATTAKRRYVLQVLELLPSFRMPTEVHLLPAGETNPSSRTKLMQPVEVSTIRATDPERAVRARRARQVTRLSFVQILAQVVACVVAAGAVLFVVMKVALPWMRQFAAERFSSEIARWDELAPSLTPLFWFALGYSLVVLLRSRIFTWRVLSGDFVWLSAMAPLARGRGGRRRHRRQPPAESEAEVFLRKNNIQVVRQPETRGDVVLSTPRVALVLPSDPDAVEFGDCNPTIPFTLEQASAAYLHAVGFIVVYAKLGGVCSITDSGCLLSQVQGASAGPSESATGIHHAARGTATR
ncbi:hypothetical protein BBJ28_00023787 [Nothophytophthora sp. Chile5]|nr:hypothetical protein BBJ28_00023787 [Nothophytophthora sp. Chile5]